MGIIIENISEQDRPYEKCIREGAGALSDAELLAVILRTGTCGESSLDLAMKVLSHSRNKRGLLGIMNMSVPELKKIKGIGSVKALQIKCLAELSMRIAAAKTDTTLTFNAPKAVADFYMEDLRHEPREKLMLLMLDIKGRFIHDCAISVGTVDASLISPREIFIEALKYEAVRIVLVHNHPSGDPAPSAEDINITHTMVKLGDIIGIPLIDHIIIGDNRYVSFKEQEIIN